MTFCDYYKIIITRQHKQKNYNTHHDSLAKHLPLPLLQWKNFQVQPALLVYVVDPVGIKLRIRGFQ